MRRLAVLAAVFVFVPGAAAAAPAPGPVALQAQLVSVVKRVAPSVVQIETASGLGSGVIFDSGGHIVTNAHVVGSSRSVTVTLSNGKRYTGRVVDAFPANDIAVVKITAPGLRPIEIASSAALQVGQFALAVGNPLGLRSSVTFGIVSALNRTVTEENGAAIPRTIQTSAPINPGNSGGALVDIQGRLIGIPTLAASDPQMGGAAVGIGFAIPSDTVKDLAAQIIKYGKVVNSHRAYLGIAPGDTGGAGVYVGSVAAGTPAAKAGIKQGDIIRAIAGRLTPSTSQLGEVLAALKPGQTVSVVIARGESTKKTVKLTLGSYPGS
jgi:S1-C subfamily serine protease